MAVFDINEIIDINKTEKENIKLLKQKIKNNEQEMNKMENNIQTRLQQINNDIITIGGGIKTPVTICSKPRENKVNKIDVSMQFELLSYCTKFEELEIFLPSAEDSNYDLILNTLLLQITKEEILCQKNLRKEKKEEYIQQLEQMKNFIYAYQENQLEKETDSFSIERPKIFYTTTPSGKICLINDLKEINKEAYPEFLTLFSSILAGNPKKPKTIDHSEKKFKNSFLQVRLNDSRMTFSVLSSDTLVLTGAFVKKVKSNSMMANKFRNIDITYSKNKDFFLEHLNDQLYLSSQEKITEEVYKILRKEK